MQTQKLVSLLLLTALTAVSSAQRYVPGIGDTVQVWRSTFGPGAHQLGKAALTRELIPQLSKDRLVRLTVMAENSMTGEVVTLNFSDPYNVGDAKLAPFMNETHRIDRGRRSMLTYRIFAFNDEATEPRVGDTLLLYWTRVTPNASSRLRQILSYDMITALKGDPQIRDSYFAESETPGDFLSIAFSSPQFHVDTRHGALLEPMKGSFVSPMKVEHFRIFSVTWETKK